MILTINSKTHGTHEILIDDEDYDKVKDYTWGIDKNRNNLYAQSKRRNLNGKWDKLKIHRIIMDCPARMCVDHINGNALDNRKENLRICTSSENTRNQKKILGTSSNYKGVCFHKRIKKWAATISVKGKLKHLGYFENEDQAAIQYNIATLKYYGEFARPNINIMMHKGI